jgi:hypothetical protein
MDAADAAMAALAPKGTKPKGTVKNGAHARGNMNGSSRADVLGGLGKGGAQDAGGGLTEEPTDIETLLRMLDSDADSEASLPGARVEETVNLSSQLPPSALQDLDPTMSEFLQLELCVNGGGTGFGAIELAASSTGSTSTGTIDAASTATTGTGSKRVDADAFVAEAFVAEAQVELDLVAVFAEFGAAKGGYDARCTHRQYHAEHRTILILSLLVTLVPSTLLPPSTPHHHPFPQPAQAWTSGGYQWYVYWCGSVDY